MSKIKDALGKCRPILPAVAHVTSQARDAIIVDICERDRAFFALNPSIDEFDRQLVKGEEGDTFDFPTTTIVHVVRGDHPGMRMRSFFLQDGAPFDDRKKFVAELKRVSIPGGRTVCVVDIDPDLMHAMEKAKDGQ